MDGVELPLLVIVMRRELTIAELHCLPENRVVVDGEVYVECGSGCMVNGFYDWLFSNHGELVGVRYFQIGDHTLSFFCEPESLGYPYLEVESDTKSMTIWFDRKHAYDPRLTIEQVFGNNLLAKSRYGEYAITFGTGNLTQSQWGQLCGSGIRGASASI